MRTVVLPTGAGDNVLALWFRFWSELSNVVDELIVYKNKIGHGRSLTKLIPQCEDGVIMFIEDDALVLNGKYVDQCFKEIEEGRFDVLGSPRMSCSMELANAAKKKYNLNYTGLGDKGPGFWPCFFFAKKSDLMRTDLHFLPKGWKKEEYIKELDYTVEPNDVSGDVNWWISIQLRYMDLKFKEIPQWHLPAYDLDEYKRQHAPWKQLDVPWIHIGSLTGTFGEPKSELEKQEFGKRQFFLDLSEGLIRDHERYKAYKELLNNKI